MNILSSRARGNLLLVLLIIVLGLISNLKGSYGRGYSSKYAVPFSKWRVTIINNMSQLGTQLFVHCKSKENDLEEHVVEVGGQYSWSFKENILHSTLYWCKFAKQGGFQAEFQVYWPEASHWLSDRCDYSNCIWAVTDQGFSLKNIPQNTFEFQHPWELHGN